MPWRGPHGQGGGPNAFQGGNIGRTFHDRDGIIFPVSKARNEISYTSPSFEFVVEEVAFIEKEDDLRLCEQRGRADGTPELIAIL